MDIATWRHAIRPNDVALFLYAGHGGANRPDPKGGDETATPPRRDPVKENDDGADRRGRKRKVDGMIGLGSSDDIGHKKDDDIKIQLADLPANATKVAIFQTCHANEACLGTADPSEIVNISLLNSSAEAKISFANCWTFALAMALFDLNNDNFAEADANRDRSITDDEWFNYAKNDYVYTPVLCRGYEEIPCSNLDPGIRRPIATGYNGLRPRPNDPGPARKQGFDGCGVCSDPDFGDAPDNGDICIGPSGLRPRSYRTALSNDGPRYNEWIFQHLGATTDSEADGLPTCLADGDAGDDGVAFGPSSVDVTVTIGYPDALDYRLDAWWDQNDDGDFDDPSDHVIISTIDYNGMNGGRLLDLLGDEQSFTFHYNLGFAPSEFFSRFRLTFGVEDAIPILPYSEFQANDGASHGEVEDYFPSGTTSIMDQGPGGSVKANLVLAVDVRPTLGTGPYEVIFSLPSAGHATLRVFDVAGRAIATLVDANYQAGRHHLPWPGLSNAGHPVAPGIYLVELTAGQAKVRTKLVLLR